MKDNIRLIHERIGPDIRAMEVEMHNATRFYFLGFGYARENLDVLGIPKVFNGDQRIFGTALGLSGNSSRTLSPHIRRSPTSRYL